MWVFAVAVAVVVYAAHTCISKRRAARDGADEDSRQAAQLAAASASGGGGGGKDKPRISFYFGSQTGTAEGFASELAENGDEDAFEIRTVDMEDLDPEEDLAGDAVSIFVVATYGEGDPTDNAVDFHSWLEGAEALPEDAEGLKFAVFGLGDTQYESFNSMGRFFQKRLAELGGECVYPYGEGDNSEDLEDDFEKWAKGFWTPVGASVGVTTKADPEDEIMPPILRLHLEDVPAPGGGGAARDPQALVDEARRSKPADERSMTFGAKHFYHARTVPVVANREVRRSNEHGSTRHVEIDISGADGLSYRTADNLSICPRAPEDLVRKLAERMGYDLDRVFTLGPGGASTNVNIDDAKALFPVPCSVEQALSMYLNIVSVPKRNLLKHFAYFATTESERQSLMELANDSHHTLREKFVSIADVLFDHPSVDVPLNAFVQMLPTTKPREYTISSSSLAHPGTIHATISVEFKGLCSNYVDRATTMPGTDLRSSYIDVAVHESTFRLPANPAVPIIMVGPGTGIAPMRAFLQERQHQRDNDRNPGTTVLYFGCRNRDNDDIYSDELQGYLDAGVLTRLEVAYSREQKEKVYVQHLLARDAAELWRLVDGEGAHFYVCGGTGMGNDVMHAMEGMVAEHAGVGAEEAKKYIKKMQADKRYIQELWS